MSPRRRSTIETKREILSLVSGFVTRRRKEKWCNTKLALALIKLLSSGDEKIMADINFDTLLPGEHLRYLSPDPDSRELLKIEDAAGEVFELKTTDEKCNEPLLDSCARDADAAGGCAWDLLKRDLTKLHPSQLGELKERLAMHYPADDYCLASLFLSETTFEWLMDTGAQIVDCVHKDDRVIEKMKENLSKLDPDTDDYVWEGAYDEQLVFRRANLSKLNELLTRILTYQFMCESLAAIPNQWPGFCIAKDFFDEKGLDRQKLNRIGEVIDVDVFTNRWVKKKPGKMVVNCRLYSKDSLRQEYRVPRDVRFMNWLSNAANAIDEKEAYECLSGSATKGKWRDFQLCLDNWFRDYVMTRTTCTCWWESCD